MLEPVASLSLIIRQLRSVEGIRTQADDLLQKLAALGVASDRQVIFREIEQRKRVRGIAFQAVLQQLNGTLLVPALEEWSAVIDPRQNPLCAALFVIRIKPHHGFHFSADRVYQAQSPQKPFFLTNEAQIDAQPKVALHT